MSFVSYLEKYNRQVWRLRCIHKTLLTNSINNNNMFVLFKFQLYSHLCGILWNKQTKVESRWCYGALTLWGRDKMAAISRTTICNAFSWTKIYKIPLQFHWNLSLRVQFKVYIPALFGAKPLFGPMIVRLLTHICITRPQWVNEIPN